MLVLMTLSPLMSGCAGTTFDPLACPVEKTYTAEEQAQLRAELPTAGPAIRGAMIDYGKLRDKARACRKAG